MEMTKPKPLKKGRFSFLKKRLFWDSLASLGSLIAVILLGIYRLNTAKLENQNSLGLIEAILVIAVFVLIFNVIRIVIDFSNEYHDEAEDSLNAMLHILHSLLSGYDTKKFPKDPTLRICVYVPDGAGYLEQRTEYVGTPEKGRKGSRVSVSRGIIGKAYKNRAFTVDSLPKNTKFIDHMKVKYDFSIEQIRELKSDRRSWAALYLGDEHNCVAIIYCDSKLNNFFGKENDFRWKVLWYSSVGMLKFFNHDTTKNRT